MVVELRRGQLRRPHRSAHRGRPLLVPHRHRRHRLRGVRARRLLRPRRSDGVADRPPHAQPVPASAQRHERAHHRAARRRSQLRFVHLRVADRRRCVAVVDRDRAPARCDATATRSGLPSSRSCSTRWNRSCSPNDERRRATHPEGPGDARRARAVGVRPLRRAGLRRGLRARPGAPDPGHERRDLRPLPQQGRPPRRGHRRSHRPGPVPAEPGWRNAPRRAGAAVEVVSVARRACGHCWWRRPRRRGPTPRLDASSIG